jgi:hypothetical protein
MFLAGGEFDFPAINTFGGTRTDEITQDDDDDWFTPIHIQYHANIFNPTWCPRLSPRCRNGDE